jgi:hypothetical protein
MKVIILFLFITVTINAQQYLLVKGPWEKKIAKECADSQQVFVVQEAIYWDGNEYSCIYINNPITCNAGIFMDTMPTWFNQNKLETINFYATKYHIDSVRVKALKVKEKYIK